MLDTVQQYVDQGVWLHPSDQLVTLALQTLGKAWPWPSSPS
jgi:hypothetical protein